MRPCHDLHPLSPNTCTLCKWVADRSSTGAYFRRKWGEPVPTDLPPRCELHERCNFASGGPCRHLRAATPMHVDCIEGCKGVKLTVFNCDLHQCCTMQKHGRGIKHCCRTCPDKQTGLVVNHTDHGMGDSVLGLIAVKGLKVKTGLEVTYKAAHRSLGFVKLFDGYDHLLASDPEGQEVAGDLQINTDWRRSPFTRLQRYCHNLGVQPTWPVLRQPLPQCYPGSVILAPFSATYHRVWPLEHWQALEDLLNAAGYHAIVTDGNTHSAAAFKTGMWGESPVNVTGAVHNARCVIASESGLAHLAGVLKTPCVVICSPTDGKAIHGDYPASKVVQAPASSWPSPEEIVQVFKKVVRS